jgi:hypothetical protein
MGPFFGKNTSSSADGRELRRRDFRPSAAAVDSTCRLERCPGAAADGLVRRNYSPATIRNGCPAVLTDSSNGAGQHLATVLLTSGRTPRQPLARLRFFEERDAPQCFGGATLAFTELVRR